jgi:hypothetical protein
MPVDGGSAEILNTPSSTKKKRSNKKRRQQQQQQRKFQSKTRLLDGNDANGQSANGIKSALNCL